MTVNPEDIPQADSKYLDDSTWDFVTGEKTKLIDQIKLLLAH